MTTYIANESERRAARVVGAAYLFALVFGMFAEYYVLGNLVVDENAVETARNIMAHERLFRLGLASNLMIFIGDVVLITALYVVLERVNRNLALLATFFRLIETTILVVAVLNDFDVLRVLSGAVYLRSTDPERLAVLARLSIGSHGSAYNVALILFGCGSSVFCYLWLKSRYIPRALAGLGVFASALMGVCVFAFIVFPEARKVVSMAYYTGPIFVFELTIGLWLVFKAIRPRATSEALSQHASEELK